MATGEYEVMQFLLSGGWFLLAFLVPLIVLPVVASLIYRLRYKSAPIHDEANDRKQHDFHIFKYVVYLLVIPAIMLVISVIMGYTYGMATVLDSMIWLIVAITIAFTWCIAQLVRHVSAKTRFEADLDG